jgi:hypothetical protein
MRGKCLKNKNKIALKFYPFRTKLKDVKCVGARTYFFVDKLVFDIKTE